MTEQREQAAALPWEWRWCPWCSQRHNNQTKHGYGIWCGIKMLVCLECAYVYKAADETGPRTLASDLAEDR